MVFAGCTAATPIGTDGSLGSASEIASLEDPVERRHSRQRPFDATLSLFEPQDPDGCATFPDGAIVLEECRFTGDMNGDLRSRIYIVYVRLVNEDGDGTASGEQTVQGCIRAIGCGWFEGTIEGTITGNVFTGSLNLRGTSRHVKDVAIEAAMVETGPETLIFELDGTVDYKIGRARHDRRRGWRRWR